MIDIQQQFTAKLWLYSGPTSWHFITLPNDFADEIKFFKHQRAGFGSVRVRVTVGESVWKTSIFPDKNSGSFLLPVKAEIRKKEQLAVDDMVTLTIAVIDT